MAKKGNIRSIRFSDEIIYMIESQAGDTFTAKFEALVTRCMWELPAKEKELAQIQERINQERNNLRYILSTKQKLEHNLYMLESRSTSLVSEVNRILKDLEGIKNVTQN